MSRLLIRTWAKSDISALAKYLNNKRIWDNCRDILPYPYIEEDAARFIESALYQDGQHIMLKGFICLGNPSTQNRSQARPEPCSKGRAASAMHRPHSASQRLQQAQLRLLQSIQAICGWC